jgi:hypothetical protein
MATYTELAGAIPIPTSLEFRRWFLRLLAARLAEVPLARSTTYYFDSSAANDNGAGTYADPFKTLAKANTVIGAWTEAAGGLRLRFKRGKKWSETTGISANKAYITIDDYWPTDEVGHELAKPLFTAFVAYATTGWVTAATRGDAYDHVYSRAETTALIALRYVDDINAPLVKVASIALCQNYPGSWAQVANVLYVHFHGDFLPDGSVAVEGVASTTSSGVNISGTAKGNVRVQNIRCDGYGAGRGVSSNYGIQNVSTVGPVVVVGCEAYYNDYHNIGSAGAAPGPFTCVNCRAGYTIGASSGNPFVGYSSAGGHEAIFHNCEIVAADHGPTLTYASGGSSVYMHTSAADKYVGLGIIWGCWNRPGKFQPLACSQIQNAPVAAALADCRAFIVEDAFYTRDPWRLVLHDGTVATENGNYGGHGDTACAPYNAVINSYRQHKTVSGAAVGNETFMASASLGAGWMWNTTMEFTAPVRAGSKWASYITSLTPPGSLTDIATRFHFCRFFFSAASPAKLCFTDYLRANPTTVGAQVTGTMMNSIVEFENFGYVAGNTFCFNNDATKIVNNAYVHITNAANYSGFGNDALALRLGSIERGKPSADSPLITTTPQLIDGHRLEYDADWNRRQVDRTALGPYEAQDWASAGGVIVCED